MKKLCALLVLCALLLTAAGPVCAADGAFSIFFHQPDPTPFPAANYNIL